MKLNLFRFFGIAIFVLTFSLYSYKLTSSYVYHTDIGRDANEIAKLASGDFTLIGPKLNFGGVHAGPYYYYLFAPILRLSNYNLNAVLIFNSILFSLALLYFYKKANDNYSEYWAAAATLIIGIAPIYHLMSRNPGNAYTFLPLLLFLLTYLFFNKINKSIEYLMLGVISGILINFHPLNLILILFIGFYLFSTYANKKGLIIFIFGVISTFSPLLLFELKNQFVILKKTIFDFMSGNLPLSPFGEKDTSKGLLDNYLSSRSYISTIILLPIEIIAIIFILPLFRFYKFVKSSKIYYFTFGSLACFILYVLAYKGAIGPHYVFPFAFFVFFALTLFVLTNKLKIFAILIIFLELIMFKSNLYSDSIRPKEDFEQAVNFVLDNKLISREDSFNLIQTVEKVPAGHEYRFFFRAKGFSPNSINHYNSSDVLLVFDDRNNFDIRQLRNWETGQFGQQYMDKYDEYLSGNTKIFVFTKN